MGAGSGQYIWPAIAMLGSQTIASLTQPQMQELQSFADNHDNLDPRALLGEGRSQINDMISLLKQRANQPVQLRSAYVQQPPVFTGGGLPMPIGLTGSDPALLDPSLLSLPGMSGANQGGIIDRTNPPRRGGGSGDDADIEPRTGDPNNPRNGPFSVSTRSLAPNTGTSPRRRNIYAPGGDIFSRPSYGADNVSEHDDLAQGAASMELFLRSLM